MDQSIQDKLKDLSGGDLNTFIENYRNALTDQYAADQAALENQRNLDHTSIMSGANMRGLLHSSFVPLDKLKYDTTTYEPNLTKLQQNYVTGLDSLYNNVAKYYNQIKKYQQKIADYNEGLLNV